MAARHLIAKIEKAEAIDHLDEIIAAADGVMVARGDLGVETSVELVPVYQKRNHRAVDPCREDGDHGDADVAIDGLESAANRAPKHLTSLMPFGMAVIASCFQTRLLQARIRLRPWPRWPASSNRPKRAKKRRTT